MNDRLLSLLGLARKAGKVVFGRDCAAEAVRKKQAKLLLLASDLSPKSKKEMEFLGQNGRVPVCQVPYTMLQLAPQTARGFTPLWMRALLKRCRPCSRRTRLHRHCDAARKKKGWD